MSRVHDMGGRFGDGPVRREADPEPVFKEEWQAHALALTLAAGSLGRWSLDESRHARECLEPRDYMRFSYYEKWLAGLTDLLVAKSIVTPEELTSLSAQPAAPELQQRRLPAAKVAAVLSSGGPTLRAEGGNGIAFELGQKLRVRRRGNLAVAGGHSRLPAYVMGRVGTIIRLHGNHVFPDSNAHGAGEAPQPLYTLSFAASDLWEDAESDLDQVMLDLWHSYLEPL